VTENATNVLSSTEPPDVSVVVVNYNTGYLFDRMFAALNAAAASLRIETIVIDNASTDDSIDVLESKYPFVTLIKNHTNVGFGRANNQAIPIVRGRYVLLLNTDAFVAPATLVQTIDFMNTNAACGVLGVKLVGTDGTLQPSCRYFPTPWNVFLARSGLARLFPNTRMVDDMNWDHASIRQCDWVPGCFYLIRAEVIRQVGLFDPRFFLYYEEIDHCRAVRDAGWNVIYYPNTHVTHIGGESAKTEGAVTDFGRQLSSLQIESELLYFRKYFGLSGALASIVLSTLADVISIIKRTLKTSNINNTTSAFQHILAVLKVMVATGFASRPTR